MEPALLSAAFCERENRRLFEKAGNDASRPRYHFVPPAMWMNDVNGALEADGWYHLFYLHDPFQADGESPAVMPSGLEIPGKRRPNRVWGHAVTRDFVNWEYLPPALVPRRDKGEIKAISGSCVLLPNGTPLIMYTSVQEDADKAGQWAALGDKALLSFCQQGEAPVIRRDQPGGPCLDTGFRDPFLFFQKGMLYAAVAGLYTQEGEERAGIHLYKAQGEGFGAWRYLGMLIGSPVAQTPYYECPKLFPVDSRWVLVYSPYGPPRYVTGLLDAENCRFEPLYEGRLDETDNAYATVNLNGLNGLAYLMSWIPGWHSQHHPGMLWGGCLSLPREVSLNEKGALFQRPARQVRELAGAPVTAYGGMEIRDTGFCLSVDHVPAGFRLEIASQQETAFAAEWDGAGFYINGERLAVTPEGGFQLYWDVCVWEVFIGSGAHCITGMRDRPLQTARLSLRGNAEVLFFSMRAGSCGYDVPNGYLRR